MSRRRDEIGESDDHNARGIELADRGWLEEAKKEFRKAIRLDPASAHAHDNLATILADQGELLPALLEFVEALKADPEGAQVHHYLGSFIAKHGLDLAVSEYRHAIELDPDLPDAHLNLGLALAEQGDLDAALVELKTAHAADDEDETIEHELAICLMDMERYPEAIAHLKRITRNHGDYIEAWVDLGIAYTAQGFLAEAEAVLLRAMELDAEDVAVHFQLAALYAAWGRSDQAITALSRSMELDADKTRQWAADEPLLAPILEDDRVIALLQGDRPEGG